MRNLIRLFLFLGLALGWSSLSAETILLENEEIFQGTITNYSNEMITIETDMGMRDISISDIQLIDYHGAVRDYQADMGQQNVFTIYLKNGEVIEGMITQFSNDFITVESVAGHGVLQLPTQSVNYVTSTTSEIKLGQREGIGYVQKKSTLNSSTGMATYVSDQLSYKMFFEDNLFGNLLLAYGNASYTGSSLQVFSVDYRMGMIFDKVQDINLYYGGSVGFLQLVDSSKSISGSGITLSAFVGAEMFFPSLPNFGFSGELGFRYQNAGSFSATDLSISTFPSFSIHYYY